MTTLSELIERDQITIDVKSHGIYQTSIGWDFPHKHFTITVSRPGASSFTNQFNQGLKLTDEPAALDVLACLVLSAQGIEDCSNFEEWKDAYGYNPDSRADEKLYKEVRKNTAKLKKFLNDKYKDYMNCEVDW
jgi:hypothetical protein